VILEEKKETKACEYNDKKEDENDNIKAFMFESEGKKGFKLCKAIENQFFNISLE
jgi:hypothetical protein